MDSEQMDCTRRKECLMTTDSDNLAHHWHSKYSIVVWGLNES